MKLGFLAIAVFAVSFPALAIFVESVPEMDGAVFIQFAALAGGLALLIKKKKR